MAHTKSKHLLSKTKKHINLLVKQVFKSALLFLFATTLLIIAYQCSKQNIEGKVIQKEFLKETKGTVWEHKSKVRKSGTTSYKTPKYVVFPDRYKVTLLHKDDSLTVYLKKEVFDTITIGDWFKFNSEKGSINEPYRSIK